MGELTYNDGKIKNRMVKSAVNTMMDIKNISKSFGGLKALSDCSMKIRNGKITAIIGPNGSGKTTLFNVISAIVRAENGDITLNGENMIKLKDYEIARKGVARTFQEVRLFRHLTIKEHIEIAISENDENPISAFRKKEKIGWRIKEILEEVGLDKSIDTYVSDLSYGQRKLLDLALALSKKHFVILLDEPVAGINPKLRIEIKEILKNLRKKKKTIVLIEHDMNFVMDLADYIYVLDYGLVIAEGKPAEIQKNKKVLEAYIGE